MDQKKFYPTAVPAASVIKPNTLYWFIILAFLTVIIFMITDMVVNPIPNPVDSLKTKKKFSSEKLNEKEKKSKLLKKTIAQKKNKKGIERDSDRPFFSFVRRQKKSQVSESLSAKLFQDLKKSVNNWWENKPFQRERVGLFPIPLLQSVSMPRGGYQLLTYEQLKMSMDPVFLMIHLYKIDNLLVLRLDKISQLSKELNISQKNSAKQTKELKELFKSAKRKNPFERLSAVVGFGIALRILTLDPLNPLPLDLFETHHGLVRNYQNFVPEITVSKELTKEVQIQVGNKIMRFPQKVTKEPKQLTELTGSLEVPNSIKNINEITPSVISKVKKRKLKLNRKKAKLMRFCDLPKIKEKSPTEEIFSVPEVPERIYRISIKVK